MRKMRRNMIPHWSRRGFEIKTQNPFWDDPELLACLANIKAAATQKQKLRCLGDFTPPNFNLFTQEEDGRDAEFMRDQQNVDDEVHLDEQDKQVVEEADQQTEVQEEEGQVEENHQVEAVVEEQLEQPVVEEQLEQPAVEEQRKEEDPRGKKSLIVKLKTRSSSEVKEMEDFAHGKGATELTNSVRSPFYSRVLAISEKLNEEQKKPLGFCIF